MLTFEFTDNTMVMTSQGVQRLADILHRPVSISLWAVQWPGHISFHKSHKAAKDFVSHQMDAEAIGPARLIDVSEFIAKRVAEEGFYCTTLTSFDEAINYEGK